MKFVVAATAGLLIAKSDAFLPAGAGVVHPGTTTAMSMAQSDRATFIKQGLVGAAGLLTFSQSASAAKYFGNTNDYPEVINPQSAVKDEEGLKEASGKIADIRAYSKVVQDLKAELTANPQADLKAKIRKDFDFSKMRQTLNDATLGVFDEDTQRGTDRLIRIILQDVTEFEQSAILKPGVVRTDRRVELLNKKLNKLQTAFDDLLKFY